LSSKRLVILFIEEVFPEPSIPSRVINFVSIINLIDIF